VHRFFLAPECFGPGSVTFPTPQARQLRQVLRLQAGDQVIVLDNSGWEYRVELEEMGKAAVRGIIRERRPSRGEPGLKITLFQALLKGDRLEFVLHKGTELGIAAFVPLRSQRCIAQGPTPAKYGRWRRIIAEAAEQSGRGRLPALEPLQDFPQACRSAPGLALIPWEGERGMSLRQALEKCPGSKQVSLFIGPEGGFTSAEIELARSCGLLSVSLGERILRAETAGLVAATVILYHYGELG